MRTITCTITTIAEALRAAGLQIIVRTLVPRASVFSARGVFARAGGVYAHAMCKLGLLLPALKPVGLTPNGGAMWQQCQHREGLTGGLGCFTGSWSTRSWSSDRHTVSVSTVVNPGRVPKSFVSIG